MKKQFLLKMACGALLAIVMPVSATFAADMDERLDRSSTSDMRNTWPSEGMPSSTDSQYESRPAQTQEEGAKGPIRSEMTKEQKKRQQERDRELRERRTNTSDVERSPQVVPESQGGFQKEY